jgi:hypothetical protein
MVQITIGITDYPRWAAERTRFANGQRVARVVAWRLFVSVCVGKE